VTVRSTPVKRLALWALVAFAAYYAVQGGEYSTVDLFRQRNRQQMLRHAIDSIRQQIDSLEQLRRRLQSDPGMQERIAREEFGMVRGDRELLYRFLPPGAERRER
jgi:cell division protein FtsB